MSSDGVCIDVCINERLHKSATASPENAGSVPGNFGAFF